MRTPDWLKSWAHAFFYGLIEKWMRMKDLPVPLHVGEEDILRIHNIPDIEHLLFEEAREHIYNVEVKALQQQCMDEGFTRGFLKGVRLVQCKAGVKIDGLTTSQASEDPSSDLDGVEIKSELRKAFSSDDESIDVELRPDEDQIGEGGGARGVRSKAPAAPTMAFRRRLVEEIVGKIKRRLRWMNRMS
ncbi:hypothetical protein IEQ34_012229 [Dendrobium chrysotoxum]|uniref:Uncharacterized protein n=1 Tax=Dendrobium chrysotoxum TaxID=161865 RepID=A0AAV7GTK6_DENCH|nr:hypothetical protein IEQ34_012229 [Dendrobium chrysotoxum]